MFSFFCLKEEFYQSLQQDRAMLIPMSGYFLLETPNKGNTNAKNILYLITACAKLSNKMCHDNSI